MAKSRTAIDRIKDAVDFKELLKMYGASNIRGGAEIRSTCPVHGGSNDTAFVANNSDKLWYCFTGCGDGGDVFDFVMQADDVGFKRAAMKLAELFNVEVDWENEEVKENLFRDEAKAFIEQMMKRNKVHQLPLYKVPSDMKFSKLNSYRGYSQETIDWWKFRYCEEGELADRIAIPFEDVNKRLVGITGRATLSEQNEKFLHRPRNLHTGYFLTGLGRNKKFVEEAGGEVIIVEGVFDAARWWDSGYKNVCAPIGTFFTEEHILELYQAGVTRLLIGFDGDLAGRNGFRKAYKRACKKFEVYFLDYGEGKDADDMTKEELDNVYKNKYDWYEFKNKYGEALEKSKKK